MAHSSVITSLNESAPTAAVVDGMPRRGLVLLVAIFIAGLLLRLPLLIQSLWYDEMFMILTRILGSWKQIVAGSYVPNNHILYALLAKATHEMTGQFDVVLAARLPAAVAGAMTGLVLAWPLWSRSSSKVAIALTGFLGLHPWMMSISGQARGYSLLLLLACLSSVLLVSRRSTAYAAAVILMLYTHPLGLAVLMGHAIVVLVGRAWNRRAWSRAIAPACIMTILLYLPMLSSAQAYWSQSHPPSLRYGAFVLESFTCALADWAASPSWLYAGIAIIVIGTGDLLIWKKHPCLRPYIEIFSISSCAAFLIPLAVSTAGETRGLIWLIPLLCFGILGLVGALPRNAQPMGWIIVMIVFCVLDVPIFRIPVQPVREAVDTARGMAEPNQPVVGIYLGAVETRATYGLDAVAYQLADSPQLSGLRNVESLCIRPPLLLVLDEPLLRRDQPDLLGYIDSNYALAARIPGRGSDALIFKPRSQSSAVFPARN